MYKNLAALLIGCFCIFVSTLSVYAEPASPLNHLCFQASPLVDEPDFCGCAWGSVYYRGEPVVGAKVTLSTSPLEHTDEQFTNFHEIPEEAHDEDEHATEVIPDDPFYSVSGFDLGATRNDVMTLTVEFMGQTITRPYRALPDSTGHQEIHFIFPELGRWSLWQEGTYSTLGIVGETVWAGGTDGLTAISLENSESTVYTPVWDNPKVTALVATPDGQIWAVGPGGVAMFDGENWQDHTGSFTGTPKAVTIDASGMVWVGGNYQNNGVLSHYDGSDWQRLDKSFGDKVTALAVDQSDQLWVGTTRGGIFHRTDENQWTSYTTGTEPKLGTNDILSILSTSEGVWVGTKPSSSGSGLAYYDIQNGEWHDSQGVDNGLPESNGFSGEIQAIHALTEDNLGRTWVGTGAGLYIQGNPDYWITENQQFTNTVSAVVATEQFVIAALPDGLYRLELTDPITPPITLHLDGPTALDTIDTLSLTTTVHNHNESEHFRYLGHDVEVVHPVWKWTSDLDGPLCTTTQSCTVPADILTLGKHTITVRVQEMTGAWSDAGTATVTVGSFSHFPQIDNR